MSATTKALADRDLITSQEALALRCPRCRTKAGNVPHSQRHEEAELVCQGCGFAISMRRGIWNGLTPEREMYFHEFISEYETIRRAEGRGGIDPEFYLSLPFKDTSGRNEEQWKIRKHTYACLMEEVLSPISRLLRRGLDVLDVGAGNCWLSYRLALGGHHPTAIDLIENDEDGLGAATHFQTALPTLFPRFRAEFNALPLEDRQFDVVIFNASFHYSEDYVATLAEALRCVRRPGWIAIGDSAWYRQERSGEEMVREKMRTFRDKYGTQANALRSLEFLTESRLQTLETQFDLRWQRFEPRYGIRWRLRPLIAKLRRRREPSRFRIYVAEVGQ